MLDINRNEKPEFKIRLAEDSDFDAIFSIWLEGIAASFDTTEIIIDEIKEKFKQVFLSRQGIFNYWVSVNHENEIVGWQSLCRCTQNPLKENLFAESSTYIKSSYRQHKIGEQLLAFVIKGAESSSLHFIIGYISKVNTHSKKMTAAVGFIDVGDIPASPKSKAKFDKHFIIKVV